ERLRRLRSRPARVHAAQRRTHPRRRRHHYCPRSVPPEPGHPERVPRAGEGTIMADPNRWFSLELEEGCSQPSRRRGCTLYDAPGPVWGYGPRQTDTVLIGEAPGQEIGRAPCRGKGESPAGAEPRHKRIE